MRSLGGVLTRTGHTKHNRILVAQVGQKSETWKQKRANMRANMRASVSLRVRVRVCACASACACARAQPNGDADRRGPRRGRERTPQPCVRRRQSRSPRPRPRRRPHRDRHGQGHPPRGTPVTAGGEHRRARRCSPSGGGGWKCRQLAPRHVMRPRSRATRLPRRRGRGGLAKQRVHICKGPIAPCTSGARACSSTPPSSTRPARAACCRTIGRFTPTTAGHRR